MAVKNDNIGTHPALVHRMSALATRTTYRFLSYLPDQIYSYMSSLFNPIFTTVLIILFYFSYLWIKSYKILLIYSTNLYKKTLQPSDDSIA